MWHYPSILLLSGGGGDDPVVVKLFATFGNSHTVGRDAAEVTDLFNSKVWQYGGTTDTINQPAAAQLDHNDTNQSPGDGEISPDLSFSNEYLAANTDVEEFVFVPYGQGASGFSTLWDPNLITGTRLQVAVARVNTAKALLEAQGKTVEVAGVLWHNANPDYNNFTFAEHQEAIDGFISYVRANMDGGSTVPIVIGGGMTEDQLDGESSSFTRYTANLTGAEHRHVNVASYDIINQQYGFSTGIPIQNFDGIHADRAGEFTKGILRHNALVRAMSNTNPSAPFTASDYDSFWDFRSGTGLDLSGNGNDLADHGSFEPLIRYDSVCEQLVFDRPSGTGRHFKLTGVIPQDYTIHFLYKPDAIATCGFIYNSDAGVSDQIKFGLLNSGADIRAGHNTSSSDVSMSAAGMTAGAYSLITLSYDSATTTMSVYLDGALGDSNSAVAAHGGSEQYFGAQADEGTNPITGDVLMCAVADYAQTQTEITDFYNLVQTIIVPQA